jgi:hypothetical protein
MKKNFNTLDGEVSFFGHLTPVQMGCGINWIGNLVSTEVSLYIAVKRQTTAVQRISHQLFSIMAIYFTEQAIVHD